MNCNKCLNKIKLLKLQIKNLKNENIKLQYNNDKTINNYKIHFLNFIKNLVYENNYYKNKWKDINYLFDNFRNIIDDKNINKNSQKVKKKYIDNNNSYSLNDSKNLNNWLNYIKKDNYNNYNKEYIKNINLFNNFNNKNVLSRDSDSINIISKNRSASNDDKNLIFNKSFIYKNIEKNKNNNIREQIKNLFIKNN